MSYWNNITIGRKFFLLILAGLVPLALCLLFFMEQMRSLVLDSQHTLDTSRYAINMVAREVDHMAWTAALGGMIEQRTSDVPVFVDDAQCSFGKWYLSPERKRLERLAPESVPLLAAIGSPHHRLHERAGEIRVLMEQGDFAGARAVFDRDVAPASREVVTALHKTRVALEARLEKERHLFERAIEHTWFFSLLSLGLFFLWGIAVAVLTMRSLAAPLRRIAAVAAQVERGELGARVGIVRGDEVGRIAATFDAMLDTLRIQINESDARVQVITRQARQMHAINEALRVLLTSKNEEFDLAVTQALGIFARSMNAERAYIWANRTGDDGRLYCDRIYIWRQQENMAQPGEATELCYEESMPIFRHILAGDRCCGGLVHAVTEPVSAIMARGGITSFLLAPIIFHGEFWGFMGLDDCGGDWRWSTEDEELLRSASLLMGTGILHHLTEVSLDAARARAEDSTNAKSEFLARMSHEIRTPMNAILGIAYLALQNDASPTVQEDYFRKIQTAAKTLLGIINDILDFSKIEARKMDLERLPFSPAACVHEVYDLLQTRAQEKRIDLCVNVSPHVPESFVGDAMRLRQVLVNLVGNALKFTEVGGVVIEVDVLAANTRETTVYFSVMDTGIGMSPEHTARLFQPFSQADSSVTRRYGGSGLGLAISKELVEMMGGHIQVESQEGWGSAFTFSVPLARDEEEHAAAATPEFAVPAPELAGKRVLLVEDNDINQMLAQQFLEQAGIVVTLADNGQEAVAAVEAAHAAPHDAGSAPGGAPFDLVLMDIQMPVMDGLEAARRIRQMPGTYNMPIVALTAHAMTRDYAKSLEVGMNDHIIKPLEPAQFYAMLARWMCR